MPTSAAPTKPLAQQLLDAQVKYHLDQLTGDQLTSTVAALAEDVLAAAGRHRIDDLVDPDEIKAIVVAALRTVPASSALRGIIELATEIAYDGPEVPYPTGELLPREQIEVLVDALLALTPALEGVLEQLTEIPLVGMVASRFMGRIVGEVLQANQAVANKVPGLGTLMSFGTGAASRVKGAADKQFETLVGNSMDKGGAFAVGRLNRILVETLRDPTTREAVLAVWDLIAQEPVAGLGSYAAREEIDDVAHAVHDLAIASLATEHAADLGEVIVESFFERFGGHTPTELLDELELSRADLVTDLVQLAPSAIEALRETGDLERIVRAQLEPFYTSDEVAALLA